MTRRDSTPTWRSRIRRHWLNPQPPAEQQRPLRSLAQPFKVDEAFSSIPGQSTPLPEMLAAVEEILD